MEAKARAPTYGFKTFGRRVEMEAKARAPTHGFKTFIDEDGLLVIEADSEYSQKSALEAVSEKGVRVNIVKPKIDKSELELTVPSNAEAVVKEWRKALKKWRRGQRTGLSSISRA
ncbi:hypothetical protein ACFLWZ_03290 [Chloroflexota bacterium]